MICTTVDGVDFLGAVLADLAAMLVYTSVGIVGAALVLKNLPRIRAWLSPER